MSLLSNTEIAKRIFERKEIVALSVDGDTQFARKLLQPASIDVTVGEIFLPPGTNDDRQEVIPFKDHLMLKVGAAVLVRSEQKLMMPSSIGGFVFPKNGHFALKGVLITNFGHIDPGFEGYLKFTVINMGREPLRLEVGLPIACIVLFDLSSPANPDWKSQSRHDTENYESHAKVLPRDFMDIEATVSRVAKEQAKLEWQAKERVAFWATLATSVFGTVLAMFALTWAIIYPFVQTSYDRLIATNIEISKVQAQVEILKTKIQPDGNISQ